MVKYSRLAFFFTALVYSIISTAQAAPVNVVIDVDGLLSGAVGAQSAAKGKPYLVIQSGVSARSSDEKKVDIEASKKYCEKMVADGVVKKGFCEPNYLFSASVTPNDSRISQQYANERASLPSAWNTTTGSRSVSIAIIDSGVQSNHPDLQANAWSNPSEIVDGLDNDGNGYVDDVVGYDFVDSDNDPSDLNEHGTHCAGSAGAVGNNGEGIAGASWSASIMAVRVLDAQGSGFLSDVATGVRYAVDNGAKVLSLSLGGSSASTVLENALSYACSKGAFIAVAAGNESANNDSTPSYPANYNLPCLISVAATDQFDQLADFSNFGASTVHIAAPGVDILSTIPGSQYGFLSGTSMATPLVAGVGALVKALKPELSGADVKNILMQSSDRLGQLSGKLSSGGRVNAANALALAGGTTPTPPAPAPENPGSGDPGDSPEEDPEDNPGEDELFEGIEVETATVQPGRVRLTGYLYYLDDESAVEGEQVLATCTTRRGQVVVLSASSSVTDEEGYFAFKFNRKVANKLRSGGFCYLGTEGSEEVKVKLRVRR